MPFAIYTIGKNFFENKKINQENLENFINTINDFNYRKKSIFINNKNQDIKRKINNKIIEISKTNLDINSQRLKELLTKTFDTIDKSMKCEFEEKIYNKINFDFQKDHNNDVDIKKKNIISDGDYYPEYFEKKVDIFEKEFLNKITLYAHSKDQDKKDRLSKIYIYHKELSKYLLPDDDSIAESSIEKYKEKLKNKIANCDYKEKKSIENKIESINKIEYGTHALVKWWASIPKNIRPQMKILSDTPIALQKYLKKMGEKITPKEIKFLENKISIFLTPKELDEKIKPSVELIWQKHMPGDKWWQHKRHWIFVPKMEKDQGNNVKDFDLLAIKHDYGVEFVDEIDKTQLRRDMELKVIANKDIHHIRDIKNHLIQEHKKT